MAFLERQGAVVAGPFGRFCKPCNSCTGSGEAGSRLWTDFVENFGRVGSSMTKEPLMSARGHRVIQLELRRNKVGSPFSRAAGFAEVKVSSLSFVRMLYQ